MQASTLEFPYNARMTYTAIKRLFDKRTKFSSVKFNDDLFIVEARHGMWISPFTENESCGNKFANMQGRSGIVFKIRIEFAELRSEQGEHL